MKMNSNDMISRNTYQGMIPSGKFDYSAFIASKIYNDVQTNLKNNNLPTNEMNLCRSHFHSVTISL